MLDEDLKEASGLFTGVVLDLGGGRERGNFTRTADARWIVTDIESKLNPDVVADACSLPLEADSFDCVKCTELLEHVDSPEAALAEIARVLKPGGVLVLSVPFMAGVHGDPDDYQRFTEAKLRRILVSAGFKVRSVKKQGLFFTVIGFMVKQAILNARVRRRYLFVWLIPLLNILIKLDRTGSVRNSAFMSSFTTGYFIIAEKESTIHG